MAQEILERPERLHKRPQLVIRFTRKGMGAISLSNGAESGAASTSWRGLSFISPHWHTVASSMGE